MIEALVRYFEERGFTVRVRPGVLAIRNARGDVGYEWAISQIDLQYLYDPSTVFFLRADAIIKLIENFDSLLESCRIEENKRLLDLL